MRPPKLFLPPWSSSSHPLYVAPGIRRAIRRQFNPRGIFLNIPYSARYRNLEIAVLSTVTAYDLMPHMAKERYERWKKIRKQLGEDFDRLTASEIAQMVGIAVDEFSMILPPAAG